MNKSIILISVEIDMKNFLEVTKIKNRLFNTELYKTFKMKTFLYNYGKRKKIFYLDDENNLKACEYTLKNNDKAELANSIVIDVISNKQINQIIIPEVKDDNKMTDIRNLIFYPILQQWFNIENPQILNNKIIWNKNV